MRTPGFKTILCPIDFGELSAPSLRYAGMLAECCGARVIAAFANTFEAPAYFTAGQLEALQEQFRQASTEAKLSLEALVDSALPKHNYEVELRIVDRPPVATILELASTSDVNLIVMGTHGRSGFNRWMLGSVTERILRETSIPLLTLRSAPQGPIRRILAAVDGSSVSRSVLELATRIAVCFEASITTLYVHDGGTTSAVPDLCNLITNVSRRTAPGCKIQEMVSQGNPAEQIVALASEGAFDLVVIGALPRRFFEGVILGSTTLQVVRHSSCPVLTVHGPAVSPGPSEQSETSQSG